MATNAYYKMRQTLPFILLCLMLATTSVHAQTDNKLMSGIRWLQQRLDSSAVRSVDPDYIEVPKQPWRIISRTKLNMTDVKTANINDFQQNRYLVLLMNFDSELGASSGFWVGYRGLGLGYAFKLHKNSGTNFTISSTGARYGVNLRWQRYRAKEAHMELAGIVNGEILADEEFDEEFMTPLSIRTLFANGYYVFNSRRYSQAAAYNQSVIQRRSAGSFLVGATWYAATIDMSAKYNAAVVAIADSLGRMSLRQANIGFGYGFNLVPARGWTINVMVMPMLSVYEKVKRVRYDCNYDLLYDTEANPILVDDYGEWNPETHQWANGQARKPIEVGGEEIDWEGTVDTWETRTERDVDAFKVNFDARVGVAYCWKRYFISANAQFNSFSYGSENNMVNLSDWYVRASFGVRL